MMRALIASFSLRYSSIGFALLLLVMPATAGIDVAQAGLEAVDEGYAITAQFDVELTPRLEEALNSGVALYFVVDFELVRPRWYWFDERSVASRLQYRLRRWFGAIHFSFNRSDCLRISGQQERRSGNQP